MPYFNGDLCFHRLGDVGHYHAEESRGERLTTESDFDLTCLARRIPLTFRLRFVYSVAIPNLLLWAGFAYCIYHPKLWRSLSNFAFYDGPAAAPDPIATAIVAGGTIILIGLFLLIALLLTMLAAAYPWQYWYASLGAGLFAVSVAAMPFGAAWVYFF